MATTKKKSKSKAKSKKPVKKPAKKAAKKVAKKAAKKATKKATKKVVKKAAKKPAKKKPAKKPTKKAAPAKKKPAPKKSAAKKPVKASTPKTKLSFKWDEFFTPLDDRLVILVEGPSEKTAGGLYIPATVSADRPNQGQVLAAGRGKKDKKGRLRPMDVKAGEKVLFGPYSGMKMILNEQEVLMLREEDILGIVG